MSFEGELLKIKNEIIENLPPEITVKKIEFEGPEIAVYSENSDVEATESSTILKDLAKSIEDSTNGDLKFKIYPGGVQGDEKDVLRKMRIGQVHSAGFTGVGLGEILPEVRILDVPFLFNNYDEVDYVADKLFDHFSKKFEEKGYILLGWAEVGFVYVFTNTPVNDIKDMNGVKMWMWEGDPIAEALHFKFYHFNRE